MPLWHGAFLRSVLIEQESRHAGHATQSIFVDDLDTLLGKIADRGLKL
ncbi:hypothetical protein SATRM34S_04263 [Streptomyces atroolivaceus]